MDSKTLTAIALVFMFALLINLPCGYLRRRSRKYSLRWLLYIHLPVPLIFFARVMSQLDYIYIPFFLLAGILGQFLGGKVEI